MLLSTFGIGIGEDFSRPKIVWAELARTGNAFTIDFVKQMVGNTGYILTDESDNDNTLYYLLGFLNSRVVLYCLNQITTRFDENGWRWLRQFVEQLRIPQNINKRNIISIVQSTDKNNQSDNSEKINRLVAQAYDLTEEEYNYINSCLTKY